MPNMDELKIERLARDLCEEDGKVWNDDLQPIESGAAALTSVGVSGRERYRKLARAALTAKRRGTSDRDAHCT
jgi:hypothetical protein